MSTAAGAQPDNRLTGLRLSVARGGWIVVVTLALGLYLFVIPLQLADYHILCSGATCPNTQISPTDLERLQQAGLSLGFYAGYLTAVNASVVLVFVIVGAVIFWRKSDDQMGIFASLTLVVYGITYNSSGFAPMGTHYPALLFLGKFLIFLGQACFTLFFYLFPDGRFAPRWIRWLVPLVLAREALSAFRPDLLGFGWIFLVEFASILFAQIYRYWRVSNAVQRQQTKWVVLGSTVGVSGFVGLIVYFVIALPGGTNAIIRLIGITAIALFILLIPLSIGVAILRSRLWDIDLLIRRTLVYTALTGLLALAYFGSVLALQGLVRLLTGQSQSQVVTVVSTLAIAALFVPLRRWVQAFIDRRFYRRKYDAARTLAKFGAGLRDEVDLENLSNHLLAAVDETMQPESVALWLRASSGEGPTK